MNAKEDLSNVFLFNSPWLFFKMVEATLLLECFYISLTATQLIPLVITAQHSGVWIFGYILFIGFNLLMLQMILDKAVLLRSVFQLEKETVGKICEDDLQERYLFIYIHIWRYTCFYMEIYLHV
jgi:hypothetical protein